MGGLRCMRRPRGGHLELARFVVEHVADALAQDNDGQTPLHWASKWGHLELARFLAERGTSFICSKAVYQD
jgi:ankyrin repeat protein